MNLQLHIIPKHVFGPYKHRNDNPKYSISLIYRITCSCSTFSFSSCKILLMERCHRLAERYCMSERITTTRERKCVFLSNVEICALTRHVLHVRAMIIWLRFIRTNCFRFTNERNLVWMIIIKWLRRFRRNSSNSKTVRGLRMKTQLVPKINSADGNGSPRIMVAMPSMRLPCS